VNKKNQKTESLSSKETVLKNPHYLTASKLVSQEKMSEDPSTLTPLIPSLSMDDSPTWLDRLADDLPQSSKVVNFILKHDVVSRLGSSRIVFIRVACRYVFHGFYREKGYDRLSQDNKTPAHVEYRAKLFTTGSYDFKTPYFEKLGDLDIEFVTRLCKAFKIDLNFKDQTRRRKMLKYEDADIELSAQQ
jgi:hypothetical protein